VLDGATALGLFVPDVYRAGNSFLPMAYGRVLVHGPMPRTVVSYVRPTRPDQSGDIRTFDVTITDPAGADVVTVEGFAVRVVDVDATHADLGRTVAGADGGAADAPADSAADEIAHEPLIEPGPALELLWRMLNSSGESEYVVSLESLPERARRQGQVARRVAPAEGGELAGATRPQNHRAGGMGQIDCHATATAGNLDGRVRRRPARPR